MSAQNGRLRKYILGAQKGAAWLAAQQADDGSILPSWGVGSVYKTLWALIATGHLREAHLLLNWTRDHLMPAPGEFHVASENEFEAGQTFYRNAFVLIGALKLGRFDVACQAALERALQYQHTSGGFFASIPADGEGQLNPLFAAMGGWTALYFGRYAEARRAGDFLSMVMDLQPGPADQFFFVYDTRRGGLITDPPKGEALAYRIDATIPAQHFFYSGISAAFLSELYLATGEDRYLQYAERYVAFSMRSGGKAFEWPSKCKDGWGAALVYRVTRNPEHLRLAQQVADITFLAAQRENGSWPDFLVPFHDDYSGVTLPGLEITAEFTFELMEVVKGLSV